MQPSSPFWVWSHGCKTNNVDTRSEVASQPSLATRPRNDTFSWPGCEATRNQATVARLEWLVNNNIIIN